MPGGGGVRQAYGEPVTVHILADGISVQHVLAENQVDLLILQGHNARLVVGDDLDGDLLNCGRLTPIILVALKNGVLVSDKVPDVIRALNYWAEQNLITLSYNSQNEISGITLESILRNRYIVKGITSTETNLLASASGQSESIPVPESTGHIIPAKRKYTPREILDFADNDTFNDIQLLAQTYLGRPLSSNDINSILYMIDGLCFDADFIEYIMDACIKDGFNSLSSIEKRAVEYAKKDINSIEEAKADKKFREGISKSIYKIFGQAQRRAG